MDRSEMRVARNRMSSRITVRSIRLLGPALGEQVRVTGVGTALDPEAPFIFVGLAGVDPRSGAQDAQQPPDHDARALVGGAIGDGREEIVGGVHGALSLARLELFDVREVNLRRRVGAAMRAIEVAVVGVDAGAEKRLLAGRQKAADRRAGLLIAGEPGVLFGRLLHDVSPSSP